MKEQTKTASDRPTCSIHKDQKLEFCSRGRHWGFCPKCEDCTQCVDDRDRDRDRAGEF